MCSYDPDGGPDLLWTRAAIVKECFYDVPTRNAVGTSATSRESEFILETNLQVRLPMSNELEDNVNLEDVSTWPTCKFRRSFIELQKLWTRAHRAEKNKNLVPRMTSYQSGDIKRYQ